VGLISGDAKPPQVVRAARARVGSSSYFNDLSILSDRQAKVSVSDPDFDKQSV